MILLLKIQWHFFKCVQIGADASSNHSDRKWNNNNKIIESANENGGRCSNGPLKSWLNEMSLLLTMFAFDLVVCQRNHFQSKHCRLERNSYFFASNEKKYYRNCKRWQTLCELLQWFSQQFVFCLAHSELKVLQTTSKMVCAKFVPETHQAFLCTLANCELAGTM